MPDELRGLAGTVTGYCLKNHKSSQSGYMPYPATRIKKSAVKMVTGTRNFVVHVGLDKTGTTTLQRYMYESRLRMREFSINYPTSPLYEYHHLDFAKKFGFSWSALDQELNSDSVLQCYIDEIERDPGHTVISSEHFSYYSDIQALLNLRQWFERRFPQHAIKVVVYFRNQVDWFLSLYGESLKWGFKQDISAFFDLAKDRLKFNHFYHDWRSIFGKENIYVVDYDLGRDTVSAFKMILTALTGVKSDSFPQQLETANQSPSQVLLEAIRLINLDLDQSMHYDLVSSIMADEHVLRCAHDRSALWKVPTAFLQTVPDMVAGNLDVCTSCGIRDSSLLRIPSLLSKYQRSFLGTDHVSAKDSILKTQSIIKELHQKEIQLSGKDNI